MFPCRNDAELIWWAAVDAVRPQRVVSATLRESTINSLLQNANRIIVVGAGKAGAAMAGAVEQEIPGLLDRVSGLVNVPGESTRPLRAIRLHPARPACSNRPTAQGVEGAEQILEMVEQARPDDVVLCLLSGGGSALLPAPSDGVSLQDKQQITSLLHACGATIQEMNAVRKHLSRIKGGRLAEVFHGKALICLIISDVIGDPLDVIASGPTAPDPTTFADALHVLDHFGLSERAGPAVMRHLQRGAAGMAQETPKQAAANVTHRILANNAMALAAAETKAGELGYSVVNLGGFIDGETDQVAGTLAAILRSIRHDHQPARPPACLLSGGETTVALVPDHGLGGRNQEMVLAAAMKLGSAELDKVVLFSGGTDGEDGPTDAAGAFADTTTLARANSLGLDPHAYLARHDAYHFFESVGGLFKPGLTDTNVMDVRVMLIGTP